MMFMLWPLWSLVDLANIEVKGRFTQGVEAIKCWGRLNLNLSPTGLKVGLKWLF